MKNLCVFRPMRRGASSDSRHAASGRSGGWKVNRMNAMSNEVKP